MSTRSFQNGDTYGKIFTTKNVTGALANADSGGGPTGTLYRNEAADGTVTVTITNLGTGIYSATCTIPSGYSVGDRIEIFVALTISGIATGESIDAFRLVGFSPAGEFDSITGTNGHNMRQKLELVLAAAAAKLSGLPSGPAVFRDEGDSQNVITTTFDGNSNRTAVVFTPPA